VALVLSGWVSHLWFGFEFGKFSLKRSNFSFFPLQVKKISSGKVFMGFWSLVCLVFWKPFVNGQFEENFEASFYSCIPGLLSSPGGISIFLKE